MEYHELIKQIAGEALANQVLQFGLAFTIAAFIHSGRVKREIRYQMESLTKAITDLGLALRKDLDDHSDKIDNLSTRVNALENKKE